MIYDIIPIDAKVDGHDIRDTLNANGGTVGNNNPSYFSVYARINKWARYKPESYNSLFRISDHERYMNNYGFNIGKITGLPIAELFNHAVNGLNWVYVLPTGGESSPFRLADFRGYNPKAEVPFDYSSIPSVGETPTLPYSASWKIATAEGSELTMDDFSAFVDANAVYYMIIARQMNGSAYDYVVSSMVSRLDNPSEIICNLTLETAGTWECLFCLGQDTSVDIESRTDLIAMPNGYFRFTLAKDVVYVVASLISPNPPNFSYTEDDSEMKYKFGFGGDVFNIELSPSKEDESVPRTTFIFGFAISLIDSLGNETPVRYVYSTEEEMVYSGTDTMTYTIINFPTFISLTDYFDESEVVNAVKIRVRLNVEVAPNGGQGGVMNPLTYFEYNLR